MQVQPHTTDDRSTLQNRVRRERHAKTRDRCRAVLLALEGKPAPTIAQALGRSRRFVQNWVYRYRDHGLEGLSERPRPGQPPKLSRHQEAAFRGRIEAGPSSADGVRTLRGRDIQRILKEEFGVPYSLQGAYDLLHRLGYSYLRPRPRHRKNDPAAMAAWKRHAPLLSGKFVVSTARNKSRSGSKMKAASGNRVP